MVKTILKVGENVLKSLVFNSLLVQSYIVLFISPIFQRQGSG